jgi:hypothetical protein
VKGVWGAARAVPGIGRLEGKGGQSDLLAVSCASAGDCTAVGGYQPAHVGEQEFAVTEQGGAWGNAERLPGIPWFKNGSGGPGVAADTVSCPSAGDCSAGGAYPLTSSGDTTAAFVDDETNGHWHTVRRVAGPPAGYTGVFAASSLSALSCATPSYCTAVGGVGTPVGAENFLVDKAPLEATRSTLKLSAGKVTYGHEQTERLTVTVTPAHAGTPAGTVTVKAGKATVCVITLTAGKGGCTLAPKKLPAGTYRLVGTYGGSPYYLGSASARRTLTVAR